MELIDIIRTSLIIFTIISSLFIIFSYVIFKIKDRNRIKPHEKEENIVPPLVLMNGDSSTESFEIKKIQNIQSRFRLINENISGSNESSVHYLPPNKMRQHNILNYYSFNKNEKMHKLRPSRLADEEA